MKGMLNIYAVENKIDFTESQVCVIAIRKANMPLVLKNELEEFIKRNTLEDCGRVPPNCLKAHMIATARKLGLEDKRIDKLKGLFVSDVGYEGYYLDNGELKRV